MLQKCNRVRLNASIEVEVISRESSVRSHLSGRIILVIAGAYEGDDKWKRGFSYFKWVRVTLEISRDFFSFPPPNTS